MIRKKNRLVIVLLTYAAVAASIPSGLMAETTATVLPEQQTPIIYYSILPTLVMTNLVSTALVTTEIGPMGLAPLGIISIYRLSAGD